MNIVKKNILLALAFLFCSLYSIELYGQESYLKNRWNIKLSYAPYSTGYFKWENRNKPKSRPRTTPDIRLEANYGLLNFLEAGVYVGYSPFKNIIDLSILSDTSVHGKTSYFTPMPYGHILSYGLNANVHFMPFFIKKSESRFDFYFTAKYGGRSSLTTKSYRYRHDLGFGFGFACYFSHHTGIYAEWLLTQGLFNKRPEITLPENIVFMPFFYERSTFRVGFTVKFKPNNEKQKNNE